MGVKTRVRFPRIHIELDTAVCICDLSTWTVKLEAEEGELLEAHRMGRLEHTVGNQQELYRWKGNVGMVGLWHPRMICSTCMPSLSALPHPHTKKQETLKMIYAQVREYNMKLSKYSY